MRFISVALLQPRTRPPLAIGGVVLTLCVTVETLLALLLTRVSSDQPLNTVYLPGLVVTAAIWGVGLGLVAATASAVAFDLFVTPPFGSLWPGQSPFLASLAFFVVVALLAGLLRAQARSLAVERNAREDADLSARISNLLLSAPDVPTALPAVARHLTRTLGISSAVLEAEAVSPGDGQRAYALGGDDLTATLIVPADLPKPTLSRLRDRVVPLLDVLLRSVREREHTARSTYSMLRRIADEQVSLRNLATLVAHSVPPSDLFDAVAREMAQILGTAHTVIARYEPDGTAVIATGTWNYKEIMASGSRWELEPGTVSDLVFHTRKPGRVDAYCGGGKLSTRLRERGVFSSVGCPIIVGSDLWGVAIASSGTPEPLPPDTEERMRDFTELAATAIANAQNLSDLIASRARVVTATDETRRRIERDLHDGTQQNLVSIGLELRTLGPLIPSGQDELRHRLCGIAQAVDNAVAELQEISRGLHPSILARGGLKQALSTLARRSAVPVRLDISEERQIPERLEVTVYYIVAEALANTVKHAQATEVQVDLITSGALTRLTVRDDGVGGADPSRGSGLTGLTDRVIALGGRMEIISPPGGGTTLRVGIPPETG
jgi:signal transduction histidine kinase